MAPLFSIITVTYNASNTIKRTLDSVDSQTCKVYEHLIVDGASKDDTLAIVNRAASSLRIVKSSPDKGIYDAMNKGIGMAKGDYLIFLNAGDAFHDETTLQKIADAIMENDYPGIVYGQTNLVDINGRYLAPRHLRAPERLKLSSFANGMLVCHQAFVVLRKIAPLYDLKYRLSADYEWCIRCLQHSKRNCYIDDVLIDYLSEGMTTANRRASLIERFKIMSKYYGFMPTLARHLRFIPRYFKHKKEISKATHNN
jgi:glycosyltransferase involved in cell wall biosynthesis